MATWKSLISPGAILSKASFSATALSEQNEGIGVRNKRQTTSLAFVKSVPWRRKRTSQSKTKDECQTRFFDIKKAKQSLALEKMRYNNYLTVIFLTAFSFLNIFGILICKTPFSIFASILSSSTSCGKYTDLVNSPYLNSEVL